MEDTTHEDLIPAVVESHVDYEEQNLLSNLLPKTSLTGLGPSVKNPPASNHCSVTVAVLYASGMGVNCRVKCIAEHTV